MSFVPIHMSYEDRRRRWPVRLAEEAKRERREEERRLYQERAKRQQDKNRWRRFVELAARWEEAALAARFIEALRELPADGVGAFGGRTAGEWLDGLARSRSVALAAG